MIIATIGFVIEPDKRKEAIQTIKSLAGPTKSLAGCLSHKIYQNIENENSFLLIEEWRSKEDLRRYLKSDKFGILMGAIDTLGQDMEAKFRSILKISGLETIRPARQS